MMHRVERTAYIDDDGAARTLANCAPDEVDLAPRHRRAPYEMGAFGWSAQPQQIRQQVDGRRRGDEERVRARERHVVRRKGHVVEQCAHRRRRRGGHSRGSAALVVRERMQCNLDCR